MTYLKTLLAALVLGGSAAALAANTDGQLRVPELMSNAEYQSAWRDLLKDEGRLPDWVINLDGTSTPTQAIDDKGDKYLVGQICEQHNCFNQRLYVAFTWDKSDAYALWVQLPEGLPTDRAPSQHATLRWLGKPDERVRQILEEQLRSDPNWY